MKQPRRRDRTVYFETVWPPYDRDLRITNISVRYDCLSGDALFAGVGNLRFPIIGKVVHEEFDPKLEKLGIKLGTIPVSDYMFSLASIPGTRLKFRSQHEVIAFINSIARALDYPPSYSLRVTVEREVYTNLQSTERRWMSEATWLLRSAPVS